MQNSERLVATLPIPGGAQASFTLADLDALWAQLGPEQKMHLLSRTPDLAAICVGECAVCAPGEAHVHYEVVAHLPGNLPPALRDRLVTALEGFASDAGHKVSVFAGDKPGSRFLALR